uniref:RING-type domain-containing protein n=1 Tax=Oncorhynchus tshawytscha TaxID=74940 RepID=A0AAZ3R751_ONCTS
MIQQIEGDAAAAPAPNPLSDLSSPLTPPVTSDPPPSPYPRPSASPSISEDQFGCHCCYDVLVNPTTLNCGHSFCRHCLALWWESSRKTECPECREKWEGFPKVNILLRDAVERLFSEVVGRRRAEIQGNPKISQSLLAFQRYHTNTLRACWLYQRYHTNTLRACWLYQRYHTNTLRACWLYQRYHTNTLRACWPI